MPCLNEAETVGHCIRKAKSFLDANNIAGEVIVADNGSRDGSDRIAEGEGAIVINVNEKGYGNALIGGISAARGRYIIMGDSDDSYDFLGLKPFLEKLREGFELVVGNRFRGGIEKGAMPWHHRYIGNPSLSLIGKWFFKSNISDFHCGLRGFTKDAFEKMDLQTTGMEFASEMVVKATLKGLRTTEVPTKLSPDGRPGRPHLRSFRDGWRHLRFLFLYSPRWLFLYPGFLMMLIGLFISVAIFLNPENNWDIHTMLYASGSIMIGFQAVIFAVFTKTFALHEKLLPRTNRIEKLFRKVTPEKGIIVALIMLAIGAFTFIYTYAIWQEGTFYELGITITMRYVIASVTLLVLGFQLLFSSFFFNILKLNTK